MLYWMTVFGIRRKRKMSCAVTGIGLTRNNQEKFNQKLQRNCFE